MGFDCTSKAGKIQVLRSGLSSEKDVAMLQKNCIPDVEEVFYSMTITLRNGHVIRRANGRPFRIVKRRRK